MYFTACVGTLTVFQPDGAWIFCADLSSFSLHLYVVHFLGARYSVKVRSDWRALGACLHYFQNFTLDICTNKKSRIYGTSDWLRQITWENKLNLPQMYVHLRPIRPQMYRSASNVLCMELASNVQLSDWSLSQSETCTFEADYRIGLKCTENAISVTFNSNSTSDRNLSDVLKMGCMHRMCCKWETHAQSEWGFRP